MKKLLSVMAALLLAVFTATGVHAVNPSQAGDVKSVSGPAVTAKAADEIPAAKQVSNALLAFEVDESAVAKGQAYTLVVSSSEFKNGTTYEYFHFASDDADAAVVDHGTATAANGQLTLNLHGASPVVIRVASGTTANGAAAGSGVAVPKTSVDVQ